MELVGYARESMIDKDLIMQVTELKTAGCTTLFIEKKEESNPHIRIAFKNCMSYLRKGDTLLVTRLDRLMCGIFELQALLVTLLEKQVHLKVTGQPIDTNSVSGKDFLSALCILAECEKNLRHERQLIGIDRAKKEGKYKGRKPIAQDRFQTVTQLINQGCSITVIAKKLGIGRSSVYYILKQHKNK